MEQTEKCYCLDILRREGTGVEKIYIHLSGCPEDFATKEYDALPWFKKLFAFNPRNLYQEHFRA